VNVLPRRLVEARARSAATGTTVRDGGRSRSEKKKAYGRDRAAAVVSAEQMDVKVKKRTDTTRIFPLLTVRS